MTHTPTPWIFSSDEDGTNEILSSSLELIMDDAYIPFCPSPDDMRHIVKCVNLHDELVASLLMIKMSAAWFHLSRETKDFINETLEKAGAL